MSFGSGVRRDWAAWLPLLFVGAMMFWTVALGLGGWSLMVVSDGAMEPMAPAPTATEPMPGLGGETQVPAAVDRIPVQMEESQEPEDVNDNPGNVHPAAQPVGFDVSNYDP
jgi:hypothetical protein